MLKPLTALILTPLLAYTITSYGDIWNAKASAVPYCICVQNGINGCSGGGPGYTTADSIRCAYNAVTKNCGKTPAGMPKLTVDNVRACFRCPVDFDKGGSTKQYAQPGCKGAPTLVPKRTIYNFL